MNPGPKKVIILAGLSRSRNRILIHNRKQGEVEVMAEHSGVMVYCEVSEGELTEISSEALGCGRGLANELEEELSAVIIGSGITDFAKETITYGADKVYVVDDPVLEDYQTDSYVLVMEKIIKQAIPQIVIMGQTSIGRDLSPRLAFRLDTVATLDCVELDVDPDSKRLLQTKPLYGGNAWAVFTTELNPQIVTVRAKAMAPLDPDAYRVGEVITIDTEIDQKAIKTRVVERVSELEEGMRLGDARIVVGGGRGIGSVEGFKQLEDLARMLGGAVGSTRAVCDNGWMPHIRLIGLTGKVINPDLYIAIALSGAIQHMAGCSGAKNIIAINTDDEAHIFRQAIYGVVGDWKEVLPGFVKKLNELKAEDG